MALLSKTKPLSVQNGMGKKKHDGEGRAVHKNLITGKVQERAGMLFFSYEVSLCVNWLHLLGGERPEATKLTFFLACSVLF